MTDDIIIDEKLIQDTIKNNYAVFLGFELSDGDISWKEYLRKLKEKKSTTSL
jgi:hypothetical protein